MTWMILLPFLPGLLGSLHLLWKRADEVKLLEGEGQTVERDKVLPAISILFTCLTFTWLLALPLCKAMTWQLFVAALPAFVYGLFLAYLASIVEDAPKMFRGGYYGMFCFTAPMLAYLGGIPFFEVSWPLLLLDSAAGLITASGLLLLKHGSDKHRSRDSRSLDIDGEDGSRFRSRLRSAGYILFHTGNTSAAFLGLAHGQLLRRSWPFVALSLFWYLAYIWLLIILIMDPHDAGDGGLDVPDAMYICSDGSISCLAVDPHSWSVVAFCGVGCRDVCTAGCCCTLGISSSSKGRTNSGRTNRDAPLCRMLCCIFPRYAGSGLLNGTGLALRQLACTRLRLVAMARAYVARCPLCDLPGGGVPHEAGTS